jgi:hypothetical protein
LAEVRRRLRHVRALRACAALIAAIPFATLPVDTLAAASYTVDSSLDSPKSNASGPLCQSIAPGNPCTLRAAIQTANIFGGTGSSIDVPAALGTITLNPSNGILSIQVGITVRSTGPGSAKVDGGDAISDLTNTSTDPVTITGLTLQNSTGGALINVGRRLTLNGVTVTGNHLNYAIFSSGELISNGSTVTGNFNGAMIVSGATTLNRTDVTHNAGHGGIYSANAPLTINGGSVSDNVESSGGGGGLVAFDQLTVTGTTFARNSSALVGGGVFVGGSATLTGVKITDNTAVDGGGGVVIDGTLGPAGATIASSTLSGNSSLGDGGGIGVVRGTLTLSGSTLNGNSTDQGAGGGIAAIASTMSLVNDTLTGNTAPRFSGGGVVQESFGGAPTRGLARAANPAGAANPAAAAKTAARLEPESQAVRATLTRYGLPTTAVPLAVRPAGAAPKARPDDVTMVSMTLSGNSAASGGGISNAQGLVFTVHDSIVAGNTGTSGQPDCLGPFSSLGYNLESAADCAFTAAGDKQGSNPQLLPLAANGGPTNTMALNPGSPALDAGDPACPPPGTDQRGVSRPQGGRCDIGAFEAVSSAMVSLPGPPVTGHPPDSQADWVRVTAIGGVLAVMVLISVTVAVRS